MANEMEEFLAAFGVNTPAPTDPPPADPPPAEDPPPTEPTEPGTDPKDGAEPPEGSTPPAEPDKTNHAFAQLRVENKQYKDLMEDIAKVLGVDATADKTTAIKDAVLQALAKKENVPVDLLRKVDSLEKDAQAFRQNNVERKAFIGFQALKTEHGLTDAELQAFSAELAREGMNPFQNEGVNIVAEYKVRHFQDILNKAVADGIKAEQERAAKANNQSTTPLNTQGQGEQDAGKINTISGLEALLKGQK